MDACNLVSRIDGERFGNIAADKPGDSAYNDVLTRHLPGAQSHERGSTPTGDRKHGAGDV